MHKQIFFYPLSQNNRHVPITYPPPNKKLQDLPLYVSVCDFYEKVWN